MSTVMTTRNQEIRKAAMTLYELYPRHVGRAAALKAIAKALSRESYEVLLEAVTAYAKARSGQDRQFTPHPATWFNQERWLDDRSEWQPAKPVKAYDPAQDAYDVLCCEVRRVGSQQVPSYPDQASHDAVKAMGGWSHFCSWETAMLGLRRKQFLEHYK